MLRRVKTIISEYCIAWNQSKLAAFRFLSIHVPVWLYQWLLKSNKNGSLRHIFLITKIQWSIGAITLSTKTVVQYNEAQHIHYPFKKKLNALFRVSINDMFFLSYNRHICSYTDDDHIFCSNENIDKKKKFGIFAIKMITMNGFESFWIHGAEICK